MAPMGILSTPLSTSSIPVKCGQSPTAREAIR
jgi:hypothetical protein